MPKGMGVSPGIGLAQALLWQAPASVKNLPRRAANDEQEARRLEQARREVLHRIQKTREGTARKIGRESAEIFDAYQAILMDEDGLFGPVRYNMQTQRLSAEWAVSQQFEQLAKRFLRLEDEYLRARVEDVLALRDALLRQLMGQPVGDFSHLARPTVVVAHSLSPADVAALDLSRLEGVVCGVGGYSSHTAIICRTLGIPAVLGLRGIARIVQSGDVIALDGESGEVWIEPGEEAIGELKVRGTDLARRRQEAQRYRGLPTVTTDGRRIELAASIGQLDEVDTALAGDTEALGMYRTELLHISGPHLPGEDEQLAYYRKIVEKMQGKAVTLRTFDDGGNTPALPMKAQPEENPVMGCRGIRLSLANPGFFRTQMRALVRASAFGSLRVVLPMVSHLDELEMALAVVRDIQDEFRATGVPFDEKMPVGILIEVPAAALQSQTLAGMVDFFVIGISDLIQFTLAIDRNHPELSATAQLLHPAVLRLVGWAVDAAHDNGIPCSLSGEAPDMEKALPLFLGLGMDGFSVNPSALLRTRQILNNCNFTECCDLAEEVLTMDNSAAVMRRLEAFYEKRVPA